MPRPIPRVLDTLYEPVEVSVPAEIGRTSGVAVGGPVDKTSPVPLYFQIAENLKRAIESGALQPGHRLDNEIQLSERLSVSRPTVRQAIQRRLRGLDRRRRRP